MNISLRSAIARKLLNLALASLPVLAMLFPAGAACAADGERSNALQIETIDVGIGGFYKVGRWTPLTVTLNRPAAAEVVIEAPDPDGSPVRFPLAAAGSSTSSPPATASESNGGSPPARIYKGLFKTGRVGGEVRVHVRMESRTILTRAVGAVADGEAGVSLPLRQSVLLVATLGKPAGLEDLTGEAESNGGWTQPRRAEQSDQFRLVELDDSSQLPDSTAGYDALDVLVVAGRYEFDQPHSDALRQWVRMGGRLIVCAGSGIAEYRDSRLAAWVPVKVVGETRLRELSGLEAFSGRNSRIIFTGQRPAAKLDPAIEWRSVGEVLVSELEGPVIVRVPFGFGQVTFSGLDLGSRPLLPTTWPPIRGVWRKLVIGSQQDAQSRRQTHGGRLAHSGITDLATQLHATQEHFPGLDRFSMWSVMGMFLLYIVLIGPIDYLLVHRVLKRPKLTWITFPLMIAAAATLAAWAASSSNGDRLQLNQLDIVDIDAASEPQADFPLSQGEAGGDRTLDSPHSAPATAQWVRAQNWFTLYSPETRRYGLRVAPAEIAATGTRTNGTSINSAGTSVAGTNGPPPSGDPDMEPVPRLSWNGIPETVFGGMYRPGGFEIGRPEYELAPHAGAVEGLPIQIWSTKSLTAAWHARQRPLVESDLRSTGIGQLSGTITHHLADPLEDWIIAYRNRIYVPPDRADGGPARILPGRPWSPTAPNATPRELRSYLTGAAPRDAAYNPLARNHAALVRVLTFHRRIGGKSYTGLDNHVLDALDLSDLLRMNRAVLLARLRNPAAELRRKTGRGDEEIAIEPTRRDTFVRIVLHVRQTDTRPPDLPKFDTQKPDGG